MFPTNPINALEASRRGARLLFEEGVSFPTNPINALEARVEYTDGRLRIGRFPTNPINALEARSNPSAPN